MKKITQMLIWTILSFPAWAQYGAADTAKTVAPIKLFDNFYYIGNDFVSSYLLVTDKGLVLIDALYGKYPAGILNSIRDLGFDPLNLKYILCTHGHWDHYEGADTLHRLTGARIGMTDIDWQMAEGKITTGLESKNSHPIRDLVIRNGDSLKMGNTTLHFFVTPGHTLGVLSMSIPLRDHGHVHKGFLFGGVGLNFSGVSQTQHYIESVRRILSMKGIEVNITNHPGPGQIFERAAKLKDRRPGTPNPFVDPAAFQSFLRGLLNDAEKKLIEEKKAAG